MKRCVSCGAEHGKLVYGGVDGCHVCAAFSHTTSYRAKHVWDLPCERCGQRLGMHVTNHPHAIGGRLIDGSCEGALCSRLPDAQHTPPNPNGAALRRKRVQLDR